MNKTPSRFLPMSGIKQDYSYREDCNPSLKYRGPERRGRPPLVSMRTINFLQELGKIILVILVSATLAGVVMHRVLAQTPQDGYDSLNMAPQGQYWSNPIQGYSEPIESRYGQPRVYFQPDRPPTYYNEYGQPTTVPDPRQYQDIEGVGM